ncbi:MAG: uncharacterized protein KVP18_000304 [Porospora cf. gigantea A]|nr:MAG: hypothetical protein KVP18_000304 [Porospora cf. gigantea A]
MAPECFTERGRINEKSDIWSVACCLVEIFGGPIPFEKHVEMSANPVDFQLSPGIPKTFMPVVLDLLEQCFNWDASQRPSLDRIARVLASVTSADIRRFKMDRKLW